MHGKLIHNIAMIAVAVTLLVSVSVITFLSIKTYSMLQETARLNKAVAISASVAEICAATTSKENFEERLTTEFKADKISSDTFAFSEDALYFRVLCFFEDEERGSMLSIVVSASDGEKNIYTLESTKYISRKLVGSE